MIDRPISGQEAFALVTYTPEPLREWLIELRRLLPVESTSEPHITILPPRPLNIPATDAWQKISSTLSCFPAFEVELSSVRVFPGTNVLYLELSDGIPMLEELHATLNVGDFFHEEVFEFHPHLTVGGPVAPQELERKLRTARDAWRASACPTRFVVDQFAFVSISTSEAGRQWNRLWRHRLLAPKAHQQAAAANFINRTS